MQRCLVPQAASEDGDALQPDVALDVLLRRAVGEVPVRLTAQPKLCTDFKFQHCVAVLYPERSLLLLGGWTTLAGQQAAQGTAQLFNDEQREERKGSWEFGERDCSSVHQGDNYSPSAKVGAAPSWVGV
jgi:hypothetical protein